MMKLVLIFSLFALCVSFKVENVLKLKKFEKNLESYKDKALSLIYGKHIKETQTGGDDEGDNNETKKPKCNLEYLACVKKEGDTKKGHIKCGKKFIKCTKRCYKLCKHDYKQCIRYHPKMKKMCKRVYKKCEYSCPHYNKCGKKCKATFDNCLKSKGKNCLANFITCLKKCKKGEKKSSKTKNI